MTLEQAIDRYNNNAEYERRNGSLQGCIEFRQLAEWLKDYKRLLEQEPCDDAISREAVLDGLKGCICEEWIKTLFATMVKQLPSVTQKSESVTEFADRCRECGKMRKGHWIYDETIENWRCSKCNETPKTMGYVGTADFMAEHFKFCNHCGRRMVEPQESEE